METKSPSIFLISPSSFTTKMVFIVQCTIMIVWKRLGTLPRCSPALIRITSTLRVTKISLDSILMFGSSKLSTP
jgi:hypothetical protein